MGAPAVTLLTINNLPNNRGREFSPSVAASTAMRKNALWKGELGVAVLIADISDPERSAMPFFE